MDTGDTSNRLDAKGQEAADQSSRGNVPGSPTWPITVHDPPSAQPPPPVGLNWKVIEDRFGLDRQVLEYCGVIVLPGEYFPDSGYFINAASLTIRFVDVGNMALAPGYFLGELATRNFRIRLDGERETEEAVHPVIPSTKRGVIIGLFAEETQARRAYRRILQNSLASGLSLQPGPLGLELHVQHPELPGRVASVIASHSGAVISLGGSPIVTNAEYRGASATGFAIRGEGANVARSGTGTTGASQARARDFGSSEQALEP